MSQPNSKKQKKNRDRRKKYERQRNLLKQYRKKNRGKPLEFKYTRAEKVYCQECRHSKKMRSGYYYCDIYDKDRVDNDLLKGWGFFDGNKEGNCIKFKKKRWFQK